MFIYIARKRVHWVSVFVYTRNIRNVGFDLARALLGGVRSVYSALSTSAEEAGKFNKEILLSTC